MAGISSDVLGKIILTTYQYFPDLFSSNYTLGQILTTVRSNGTFMTLIANSTGVAKETLTKTVDLYLMIREYMQPTTAPITPTETDNESDSDIFSQCNPDVGPGDFTNFTLLPALLIIFVLSFLSQRKRSLNCCGRAVKRPGLCIPVNLVDSYENRFAFACAFGATTIKCLGILFFGNYDEIFAPTIVQLIEDPSVPGWMAIIWKIIAMFVIGLAYYPLFACMATDFKITGLAIGFVYSACWVAADVAVFVQCPQFTSNVFPMDIFLFQLPVTLCLLFITLRYFVLLIKAIYRRCSRTPTVTEEEDDWKISYKYKYVLKLLAPVPKEQIGPDGSLKERFKGKLYKWKPEFKYSTRVVCTYFISFIGIYEVLLLYIVLGVFILKIKASIPEDAFQYLDAELGITGIKQWFVIGAASLFVAVVITAIYSVVLMANMLSWYRGHLFRLQRGEKDFLPMKILSANPSSITVATLKYCGYQVAYLLWGVTICVLLLTVVGFVVGQQLIVPMVHGRFDSFLWEKIKNLWPAFVISLVFFWIQLLLSKYVFLMDRGTTLALNNRRLFHVCTFFLFFFNIFLGVISCLKRILIGAVLGVMFLGRTQKSVISRDYEMMDPGFNAYLGYLFLEHTHANPVLVTFCQLLIKSLVARQRSGQEESGIETNHALQTNHVLKTNHVLHGEEPTGKREIELNKLRQKHSRRVRNRWYLLMTLHNNPSIQEHRRSELFIVKSPFAAFQVVIQQGVTQQLNQEQNVRKEAEVYDIKL